MIDRTEEIKRVLITGVTGSAGKYLVDYLHTHQPQVEIHGTTRRKALKTPIEGVKLHEVDLLDFGSILTALNNANPDCIFHLAANSDKGFEIPTAIIQNNAVGTANLFEAIRQHQNYDDQHSDRATLWNPIIVNVSSSEVYGDVKPEDVPIKENCPFRPMSPYAISKVAQDHLGTMYHKAYGLKVINTRAFSYVNLYHKGIFTSAFARQIALVEAGKLDVLKHGNLDSVRCFVNTEDIMEAYWLVATKCRFGEAYNLGGSTVMSVEEVLRRLIVLSTVDYIKTEKDPELMRPADVTMQIPDVIKFKKETEWKEHFDVDKVLTGLLDYWRAEVNK